MKIFREKPNNKSGYIVERIDKDGTTFWFDWNEWIHAIEITPDNAKEVLPANIYALIPKWEEEMCKLQEEKYELSYPIKLVSLHFIHNEKIYKITPEFFNKLDNKAMKKYYFQCNHKNMEKDLQEQGCLFTMYNDILD